MKRERLVLERRLTFVIPKGVKMELWGSWNNPEKAEGTGLFLGRLFRPYRKTIAVGFFVKGSILKAINKNPTDCEVYVDGQAQSVKTYPFEIPNGTTIVIEDEYPRFVLRFVTPRRRRKKSRRQAVKTQDAFRCLPIFLPRPIPIHRDYR